MDSFFEQGRKIVKGNKDIPNGWVAHRCQNTPLEEEYEITEEEKRIFTELIKR